MLSIVIVTCNRCEEVLRSICSCDDCASEDYELIIVDNASIDDTRNKIKDLSKKREINLNYIYLQDNLGGPEGRNIGFNAAKGDVVYFLDDDAWIDSERGALHKVYHFMKEHPNIGILTTDIYNTQENCWQYLGFPLTRTARSEGEVLYYVGASHFINKNSFNSDIIYPPSLFYGEELYAALRTWGNGKQVYYSTELKINHHPSVKTRMKEEEMKLRNLVNPYVIKRLLLPTFFRPIIYVLFILRLIKHYYKQPCKITKGLKDARDRYDRSLRNDIGIGTVLQLCKKYRCLNIF